MAVAADHHVFHSDAVWGVVGWEVAPVWLHTPAAEDMAMFVGVCCWQGREGEGPERTGGDHA